jgi:hypothetical protein
MSDARVVLRLFSGRPNPSWALPRNKAAQLRRVFQSLPLQPQAYRPEIILGKPSDPLGRPRSGYRGFRIFADGESQIPEYEIFGALVLEQATGRIRTDGTKITERIVWRTVPDIIRRELDDVTLAEVSAPGNEQLITGVVGPYVDLNCGFSPKYVEDGGPFNKLIRENNCYNYATLKPNPVPFTDPAVPGPDNGKHKFTPNALRQALAKDKLVFKGFTQPTTCPRSGQHWIAAMVRRSATGRLTDVHFLRLDKSGMWSHKDGDDAVTDEDDKGNKISDLTQAVFLGFPELAGFFLAKKRFRNLIG